MSGKENSARRRKKSERKEQRQLDTFKERQTLKDIMNKCIMK